MALDIIGAGFGRTGTSSLKMALEHLGFGPTHHMFEIRDNPPLLPLWQAASRGQTIDFDEAFAHYRSQVDWPGARYWRELADHYPHARVILTHRDPDEWFDSVQHTIVPFLDQRGQHGIEHVDAIANMAHRLIAKAIFDDRMNDRAHATAVFNQHIATVQATIPAARLLTFDVSQGWEPLCNFLGCPVPQISFPRLNSSRQFVEELWGNA